MEEGGSEMGQLALSKGPARMGIHCHVQGATIPSKWSSSFAIYKYSCMFEHFYT